MHMRHLWLGVVLMLAGVASAHAADLRLPVRGEIGIDEHGAVFAFDTRTEMAAPVKAMVDRAVRQWKFEPIVRDGVPVRAKALMHLTLIAREVPEGYQMQIEEVQFAGRRESVQMGPPRYPREAAMSGVGGDVLLAVRVDAQGNVIDAAAIQVSWPYRKVAERAGMKWGALLSEASLKAARGWKFAASAPGEEADATLLVPVSYRMGDQIPRRDEGWRAETAGPLSPIPWLASDRQAFDASSLQEGQALVLGHSFTLLTPVIGATL